MSEDIQSRFHYTEELEDEDPEKLDRFVLFNRLGRFQEGDDYFKTYLCPFAGSFIVFAEYADFLYNGGEFGKMKDLLSQFPIETVDRELRNLVELWKGLCQVITNCSTDPRESAIKTLADIDISQPISDAKIQIITTCVRILGVSQDYPRINGESVYACFGKALEVTSILPSQGSYWEVVEIFTEIFPFLSETPALEVFERLRTELESSPNDEPKFLARITLEQRYFEFLVHLGNSEGASESLNLIEAYVAVFNESQLHHEYSLPTLWINHSKLIFESRFAGRRYSISNCLAETRKLGDRATERQLLEMIISEISNWDNPLSYGVLEEYFQLAENTRNTLALLAMFGNLFRSLVLDSPQLLLIEPGAVGKVVARHLGCFDRYVSFSSRSQFPCLRLQMEGLRRWATSAELRDLARNADFGDDNLVKDRVVAYIPEILQVYAESARESVKSGRPVFPAMGTTAPKSNPFHPDMQTEDGTEDSSALLGPIQQINENKMDIGFPTPLNVKCSLTEMFISLFCALQFFIYSATGGIALTVGNPGIPDIHLGDLFWIFIAPMPLFSLLYKFAFDIHAQLRPGRSRRGTGARSTARLWFR